MGSESAREPGVLFSVLDQAQCDRIFLAACEVLDRVGSRFHEPLAVDILRRAGCRVSDGSLVFIPAALVHDALGRAPRRFDLFTRDGLPAIQTVAGRAFFGPGPTCCYFIDPHSGERRLFVKNDAALTARVCDALPNMDYVMSLGSVSDCPPDRADVHEFDAMVRETTKPIMSWSFTRDTLATVHRMCCAVKGSVDAFAAEPFMIFYAEPSSPLKHSAEALCKLIYCAENGIPCVYAPAPIAGGTAPATLAGVLVQNLAETLGGVVVSQLVRSGAPIVVGGVVSILDMRTTILSYGAPELALLSAGATDVAARLGLPMFSTAGCTDAKTLDEQAAAEAAISIMVAALSRATFVHDAGYSESGMTGSLQQLVVCDELIGMARHVAKGIRVDGDTLAVKAITEASATGDYLTLDHTARHFREQFWFPSLIDRRRYGEWAADGKTTMGDRARARLRDIVESHRAPVLDGAVARALDEIVSREARRSL